MALLPPDPVFCLKENMKHIHNLCFISDESCTSKLLAATEEGFVYLWNLETNRVIHKQQVGTSVQAIHYTSDGLITQEKSGVVKLWDTQNETSFKFLKEYNCNGGYCRSILVENILIVPQINSTLDAIEINTMQPVRTYTPQQEKLGYAMCLQKVELKGNIYILAGYETGDIILWDFRSAKQCSQLRLMEYITSLTFDPVNCRGICGNSSNILQVFTISNDFKIELKCEISLTNNGCSIVKLRSDRKIFVSGGWDGRLRLYSWKSLRLLVVLNQHRKSVTDVQFSRSIVPIWNSNIMAAGSADGIISLWNLYN